MTKTNAVFTECTVFGRRRQIILRIFLAGVTRGSVRASGFVQIAFALTIDQ
jgi:hypothetical protein